MWLGDLWQKITDGLSQCSPVWKTGTIHLLTPLTELILHVSM